LLRADKAAAPIIAGRADGVQPRFLETLNCWGLATEVHEEGPLIERTAIYKDGKKLLFAQSHQSDSRYRGLHIITQGQIERIYIRDLLRHKKLVERNTVIKDFNVLNNEQSDYPVQAVLRNEATGAEEEVKAKFLVGSDGAGSFVRKKLQIPCVQPLPFLTMLPSFDISNNMIDSMALVQISTGASWMPFLKATTLMHGYLGESLEA
jgi:phenol 2-monooxygenase (NADPH)